MNSLYTNEVKQYIDSRDWPSDFKYIVEEIYVTDDSGDKLNIDNSQYLQFVIYRHNWITYTGEGQFHISNIVREMFMKLRNDGIPIYLEAKE